MFVAWAPCGALYMKRSVVNVRCAASVRVTYPRSTPTGYAVSANPTAAMLEKLLLGQRSGVSPLLGSVRSQNQLKVRRSSVSRNAVCLVVSAEGGIGPLIPVIDVALVHAEAATRRAIESLFTLGRIPPIEFLCMSCGCREERCCKIIARRKATGADCGELQPAPAHATASPIARDQAQSSRVRSSTRRRTEIS